MTVNHRDVVDALYAEDPPDHDLDGALDFLLRLLPRLPAHERAGLLLKPAGENIVDYRGQMVSAGRICYPDGQLYKVLTDIPTTNGPSWQDDGTVDPSRYLPVTQEPPQDDDPPVSTDLRHLIESLVQQGETLIPMVADVQRRLSALEARPVPAPVPYETKALGMTLVSKPRVG